MSEEEMVEFVKCANDPAYFVKNYGYGFNPTIGEMGMLPIEEFQVGIINHIHENRMSLIKKSRQMYVTSTLAMYAAWSIIFKCDYQVAIISPKKEISIRVLGLIKNVLQNVPNAFFNYDENVIIDNKSDLRLAHGSCVKAFSAAASAGRGYSLDLLIIDEAAYMKDIEAIWMGAGMTLSQRRGRCVIASTPNNVGDFFYKTWEGAFKGENDFKSLELDWTMNPSYTKDYEVRDGKMWSPWFEKNCKYLNNNQDNINSELWGLFVSGARLDVPKRVNFRIDSDIYDKIIKKIDKSGISLTDYMKELINKDLEK
jgi:hypothetical protein